MSALRRRVARFALILLLAVLGLELLLRAFQPGALQYFRNLKLLHVYHPEYLVGLEANADYYLKHNAGLWEGRFTTNSLGHRGSPEPDATQPQLVCQGDSLVMGFGVSDDETFCAQLNGIELGGRRHQAINLGVDAFGTEGNYYRLREGARSLPNLKVALFFVSPNDFTLPQALRDRGTLADDEISVLREQDPRFRKLFHTQFELTRYSITLHTLSVALQQTRINLALAQASAVAALTDVGWLAPAAPGGPPPRGLVRYVREAFFRPPAPTNCAPGAGGAPLVAPSGAGAPTAAGSAGPACPLPVPAAFVCLDREPAAASLAPLPELTARYYERMIALSRERNFRLIPVFLPVQTEELYCEMNGRYSPFSDHILRAKKFFEERGVRTLDLRSYSREMCGEPLPDGKGGTRPSRIEDYIIQGDGHLTRVGNNWAARIVRTELTKLY